LALDLYIAPDTCGGSADEGEAVATAFFGACSAIFLDRIKVIAQPFNQERPLGQP
jgi:hypothetical protein